MSDFEAQYYPPLELPPPGVEPVFWPINRAQQAFLNSRAELALGGGQSGGGKTMVLAADAMQEYKNPRLRGLLLRTTLEEMQELEDIQQRMYEPRGARWQRRRSVAAWVFPSGASIRPGYLAHDKHLKRYQGNPFSWLGIDEIGQHPENRVRFLLGWLAAPIGTGLRVRGRFTANPGGIGHGMLMKVFLRNRCPVHFPASFADDRPHETSVFPGRVYRGACWTDDSPVHKTTAFFPARLADNPLYGREKLESLLSQSKAIQQQLLYGCWCNAAGLYFDFMRPDDVVPYATIGDSWWWQHFLSIDYGYGNSAAAAGLYAINPNGVVFKTRERVERKMSALKFAKGLCKDGFPRTDYPFQGAQSQWLKKLKVRDPEPPRMSFCVMDEAMDQHRGTGKSVFGVMSEVFAEHGISSIKAAHDPQGNAQVCYNGLANKLLVLTRDSADLPLSYRSISSRIVDDRKAVKKIQGAWEDDVYDECISEGTLVLTEHGEIPIEQILIGEKVLTRAGLCPVRWAGITGYSKPTITLETTDGRCLEATGNHPVWVDGGGFIPLDQVSYGDKLLTWVESKLSSSMELSLDDTRTPKGTLPETTTRRAHAISAAVSTCCIGKSISTSKDQFLLGSTFTTSMRTRPIMSRLILKHLTQTPMQQSILLTNGRTQHQDESTCGDYRRSLLRGIGHQRDSNGTGNTSGTLPLAENRRVSSASNASRHSKLSVAAEISSVPKNARRSIEEMRAPMMSQESVGSATRHSIATGSSRKHFALSAVSRVTTGERRNVYNLTVEGQPEFLANGILVHNCSYAYNTWRQNSEKPARTALADELAQLRKEGLDETSIARIAWQREQAIQSKEREGKKGIRLSNALEMPRKR